MKQENLFFITILSVLAYLVYKSKNETKQITNNQTITAGVRA